MRGLFLTLTVLMISACGLPMDIATKCGIPFGYLDKECMEAGYTKKYEAECTANPEKYSYAVATPELSLKERNHQICVVKKQQARSLADAIREEERRADWLKAGDTGFR